MALKRQCLNKKSLININKLYIKNIKWQEYFLKKGTELIKIDLSALIYVVSEIREQALSQQKAELIKEIMKPKSLKTRGFRQVFKRSI